MIGKGEGLSDLVEELAAKQAITEVLHRYCHAVDQIDAELGSRIWHPGGSAHYEGVFEGTGEGFMEWVLESMRSTESRSHLLTNVLIHVDGDQAKSESYVHAFRRMDGKDVIVYGRYSDTWSRRDAEWRIDDRRYRRDVLRIVPATSV